MSAKGLPPAVRLDPLPLLPTCPGGNIAFNASLHVQKINSPPTPLILNPNHNSPPPQTCQTPARGLTPIIITPESSSRPHTPAASGSDRGTPGLASMRTFTATSTAGIPTKKLKFEFKLEPVELDPILPSGKRVEEKAKAVSMDEDEGTTKLPQLPPTPCMTPVLHPVDMIEGGGGLGGEKETGDKSPRTGRTILPSRPDDPAASAYRLARNHLSLSDLADVAERERLVSCGHEDDVKRGRTTERRRNSRFREEKGRYKPYDPGMRSSNREIPSRPRRLPSPRVPTPAPSMPSSRPASASHPLGPPDRPPPPSQSPALAPISPPNPIPKAADHLIHLFNTELQNHIQAERDSLRSEYEHLIRERSEIQRERELMRRERAEHGGKDRELMGLREENRMLRIRVEELQVRLDSVLRDIGTPSSAPSGDRMKPATPL